MAQFERGKTRGASFGVRRQWCWGFDTLDHAWTVFKLLVTSADGATTVKTLAELGIVSIDLTADATSSEPPVRSVINGQTTFARDDGATGTVADVNHVAEAGGCWLARAAGLWLGRVLEAGDVSSMQRMV
ncbi:hypothetical protein [Cognatiyoonia sp. IB215182]|uniref:hypothetical protein n=1 Tax=Cognatiyoonia sp. IB215182 TaxID=3097353 RepID=UPI002A102116|nr:hypothetical protein [Cognatiyoonia sp. IB215182]MDX8352999.1 hypothetical protein [Cognatiyoonia sp. IB215182]